MEIKVLPQGNKTPFAYWTRQGFSLRTKTVRQLRVLRQDDKLQRKENEGNPHCYIIIEVTTQGSVPAMKTNRMAECAKQIISRMKRI